MSTTAYLPFFSDLIDTNAKQVLLHSMNYLLLHHSIISAKSSKKKIINITLPAYFRNMKHTQLVMI